MNMYNPYQPYYQPLQNTQQLLQNQQIQPTQQIQSGGFISVRSEIEARNYPVAPGNSVTFIDENAPYCYTKTMGFSQLDRPKFEKFRLVKEEEQVPIQQVSDVPYALKTDIEALNAQISQFQADLEALNKKMVESIGETKHDE